jgi:hypothetical protein
MLRVLLDFETLHGIPTGTMRSAISRGWVTAVKKGRIVMVDDEDPLFLAYKQTYRPRKSSRGTNLLDDHTSFHSEHSEVLPSTFSFEGKEGS